MINRQMELSLTSVRTGATARGSQGRQRRAAWWFDRMRQAVDRAFDWSAAGLPRPEQAVFQGFYRQALVPSAVPAARVDVAGQEKEVCA